MLKNVKEIEEITFYHGQQIDCHILCRNFLCSCFFFEAQGDAEKNV